MFPFGTSGTEYQHRTPVECPPEKWIRDWNLQWDSDSLDQINFILIVTPGVFSGPQPHSLIDDPVEIAAPIISDNSPDKSRQNRSSLRTSINPPLIISFCARVSGILAIPENPRRESDLILCNICVMCVCVPWHLILAFSHNRKWPVLTPSEGGAHGSSLFPVLVVGSRLVGWLVRDKMAKIRDTSRIS